LIRLTKKSGDNIIPEQVRSNDHPHLHDHLQTIHDPMINEQLINDVPSIIRETFVRFTVNKNYIIIYSII